MLFVLDLAARIGEKQVAECAEQTLLLLEEAKLPAPAAAAGAANGKNGAARDRNGARTGG